MTSPVSWALLALVAIVVVWWASQVDWSAWYGLCHASSDRDRRAIALLAATAMLLALQSIVLRLVARDVAVVSVTTGWLPAAIVLALAYYWHQD